MCEHAQHIVGSLVGVHRGEALQLRYFLLQPAYRGLGLGTHLLGKFLAFMRQKHYQQAYLLTTQEQTAAIVLYTRAGFSLTAATHSGALTEGLLEQRYDLRLAP